MDQRAQKAGASLTQLAHQIAAAVGPDLLILGNHAGGLQDVLDLLVELVAVGDDHHAGVGVVLQNPLGQKHHEDALARALGVPNDAAAALADVGLGGLEPEVLVGPGQLLDAAIEQDEVVDQFQEPVLAAHLEQVLVELGARIIVLVFLPPQEVLLFGLDGPEGQTLGVVSGENELDGPEEPLVEFGSLVGQVLPDAVPDGDAAVLEFDHTEGDPVHVKDQVGTALAVALEGDLFGDGEVVLLGVLPVDDLNGLGGLTRLGLDVDPVTQELVDRLIVAVEAPRGVGRLGAQLVEHRGDLCACYPALREPIG